MGNPQASYYRARYYDSTVGRFSTEDPVAFDAGPNFYAYVRNNPVIFIDPSGLQVSTIPRDPRRNTIVCDGHGGIRVQFGFPGTLGEPKEIACTIDCARAHEETHRSDALAANPKVCRGKADGVIVAFAPKPLIATEIKADSAELDCLRNQLDHGCRQCGTIILQRIQDVEANRAFFNKQQ